MANDASVERLRVGEVAAATGLTARTLHHYEAVGLVVPNGRTSAGYRLYDFKTLDRLYHVAMLRALGFGPGELTRGDNGQWRRDRIRTGRPALRLP